MVIIQNIVVIVLLAYSSIVDVKKRRVSNKICVCIAVISLFDFSVWNLLGIIPAFVVLLIASIGGLGGGDVKLIAALSLCLGLERTLLILFCAASAMLLFYLVSKIIKGKNASKCLPFVPFITFGYFILITLLF